MLYKSQIAHNLHLYKQEKDTFPLIKVLKCDCLAISNLINSKREIVERFKYYLQFTLVCMFQKISENNRNDEDKSRTCF